MLPLSALLITGCAQQTFTVQNKPAAVAPKEPSPIISSFLNWGRRKIRQMAKIAAAEMLNKTETQQTFVNGLLGFITRHLYPLEARVLLTIIAWVAHRYGQLYLHCSLIYSGLSSCFCIVISLFWGWNNPVQRCLPVGGGCIIHAEAVVASRTDRHRLMHRWRPAATSSRRASFSALASANLFILHRAQQHHADASACCTAAFASFSSSGIFVALGFVGNAGYHGND